MLANDHVEARRLAYMACMVDHGGCTASAGQRLAAPQLGCSLQLQQAALSKSMGSRQSVLLGVRQHAFGSFTLSGWAGW